MPKSVPTMKFESSFQGSAELNARFLNSCKHKNMSSNFVQLLAFAFPKYHSTITAQENL